MVVTDMGSSRCWFRPKRAVLRSVPPLC